MTSRITELSLFPFLILTLFSGVAFGQAPVISYSPATNVYTVNTTITSLSPANTGGAVSSGALTTFATIPGGDTGSDQPYGIAYDPTTGDIITDNFSGGAVYRYSPAGVLLNTYTTDIYTGGPKDIVVDASGNIYVANGLGADIVKITPSGTTTTITATGTAFSQPDGMAISSSGTIYIADQGTDDVYTIAPGATTATVYKSGFSDLYGVTVNSTTGVVYVSEYGTSNTNGNIEEISTTGTVSTFVSYTAGGFNSLRNLAIDASGNIYATDNGAGKVYKITPAGVVSTYVTGLDSPRATTEDVLGNLYIANSGGFDIEELSPANYSINIPLPTGMSFNTSTGQISGTPTVTSPTTVYTIVGHNASGSGYTTETITVDPTGPTGTGATICGAGTVILTASGGTPTGGTYNWYAAATGGTALATGATYSPSLTTTTTYYVDYTEGSVTCASRTAVTGTVGANPIISTAPTSGADFSYAFTAGSVTDISGAGNNGTLHGSPATTTDRYNTSGNAYSFVSSSSQYISTTTAYLTPGPQTFSISAWFKTTTAGGYIVGFGNAQTGSSTSVDRVIYMGTNGELYFGVAPLSVKQTINTITAYNDGNWHHVVATFSTTDGSNMYVDGALAASNPAMNAVLSLGIAGYWRVGYDALTGWTNAPATTYFNGSLDDVGVANTELTWAQVDVLYGAGSSSFCSGNALSLTANTVSSATYSWVGPSGSSFTSTSQNPTVPAANAIAGIYVLTVTSSTGCTSTINVTAPGNVITYTWSGAAGTTNPLTAGNWDHLPLFTSTTNLVIPTGLTYYPVLTASESLYGLTLGATATLSLNGNTLSVGCDIVNNASTSGDGIIYGSNNASGITWNGSVAAQSYTGTNTATTAELGNMTVNNSAAGTVTINSGPVDIYNTITITEGNLVVGSSPAALNLISTATQSASVAAIPAAYSITGTVTVQRYLTGGSGYRTYRLISSPVYAGSVSSNNVYSINYLQNSAYLTGNAGGGFDKTGNPTLYLYREDLTPSNATFTSGNFWGISAINNTPAYNYYMNGGSTSYNIPVGNGVMFFFRGNRASAALATETLTSYTTPVTATLSTSGTLNQGAVIVHSWYTPTSATIGYTGTGTGTNSAVRGFNLMGNPYASSIDWSTFSSSTTTAPIYGANVGPTIWLFDPGTKNYNTYNATTGVATGKASKIIPSGEGFFVQASAASPSLTFQEAAKTSAQVTGTSLLMAKRVAALDNAPAQSSYGSYLRLKMITDSVNYDDMVIGFNPNALTKYNPGVDDKFLHGSGNLEFIAGISSDSINTSVKWLPYPKNAASQVLPLKVEVSTSGLYTIQRTDFMAIPQIYEVWLMDNYKKDSLDIRNNTTYAFDVDVNDTTTYGTGRFSVVIRQDPALMFHLLNFTATKGTTGSQVAWVTENEQNYTNFTVERSIDGGKTFDNLGSITSSALGTYSFLDKSPSPGTDSYRLEIVDLNGNISYSSVVTISYGTVTSLVKTGIEVYPNPAKSTINLSIDPGFSQTNTSSSLSATPNLAYNIQITNMMGSVLKKATTSGQSWQTDVTNLVPGTYVIQVVNKSDASVVGQAKFIKL